MRELQVLMIDDQAADTVAAQSAFTRLGCRVETARGKRALATLAKRRFDLVCLDPGDPCASDVLARLAPGQYAAALGGLGTDLPARFNGVLTRPVTPFLAAVTVAMAIMTKADTGSRAHTGDQGLAA